jgi:phage-related tail protein
MARFRLKRKSFSMAGALFGVKNFKAMTSGVKALGNGGTKNLNVLQRAGEGAKGLAKAGATIGGGALAVGGVTGGVAADRLGGGDLISGGEKSAKNMEFS